jgi:tRNA (cytidine32/uridine32-2'-O)-methyltransferase
MSAHAHDILNNAIVVDTLDEALFDCDYVMGASARSRSLPWPMHNAREGADFAIQRAAMGNVAILFGNEQAGLSNTELERCHCHVNIPANPEYSSLNLAASVQVICYELRMGILNGAQVVTDITEFATDEDMQRFFEHLETALKSVNVLQERCPRQMMTRMKRLFMKAHLEKTEVRLLRGVWTAMMRERK